MSTDAARPLGDLIRILLTALDGGTPVAEDVVQSFRAQVHAVDDVWYTYVSPRDGLMVVEFASFATHDERERWIEGFTARDDGGDQYFDLQEEADERANDYNYHLEQPDGLDEVPDDVE